MLKEREMDEITMPILAEEAGIPTSSTYHFFPDMKCLYQDVARMIAVDLSAAVGVPKLGATWQQIVTDFIHTGAAFFNANRDAAQLILGPKTVPDIKNAACLEDYRFGRQLHSLLSARFHLPEIEEPIALCFRAIQISDAMFALSVSQHGHITAELRDEAAIAATAYVGCYFPALMKRRPISERSPQLRIVSTEPDQ
jgi:AcrR family transcriptional regulator